MMLDAHAIYDHFRQRPGSEKIAKQNSIQGVIDAIRRKQPSSILEVGTGIGTLTYTIVATLTEMRSAAQVVSVEQNPFCLAQLRENLGPLLSRIDLVGDVEAIGMRSFDFVVLDGGTLEHTGYTDFAAKHGLALVDGFREKQRDAMRASGRSIVAAHVRSVNPNEGAYWIIQFEPTLLDRLRLAGLHASRHLMMGFGRRVLSITKR